MGVTILGITEDANHLPLCFRQVQGNARSLTAVSTAQTMLTAVSTAWTAEYIFSEPIITSATRLDGCLAQDRQVSGGLFDILAIQPTSSASTIYLHHANPSVTITQTHLLHHNLFPDLSLQLLGSPPHKCVCACFIRDTQCWLVSNTSFLARESCQIWLYDKLSAWIKMNSLKAP